MVLTLDLPENELKAVRDLAKERGVAVEIIAREAIRAYTSRIPDEEFDRHLKESVKTNIELLRRLA